MAGPYQPQPLPYPDDQYNPTGPYPGVYPGMLPPPVAYPKPRRRRTLWWVLLVLALVGAIVAAVLTIRTDRPGKSSLPYQLPFISFGLQKSHFLF